MDYLKIPFKLAYLLQICLCSGLINNKLRTKVHLKQMTTVMLIENKCNFINPEFFHSTW